MRNRNTLLLLATTLILGVTAAVALAATVTVPAKDASPTIITTPTLVKRTDVIKVSEKSPFGSASKVRFKVYPSTTGFRPVNSSCQGKFFTARKRPSSSGRVVIRLEPRKRLCRGIVYHAEALIGTGDVPDKFAHLCVRGRETPTAAACEDTYAG